MGRGQFNPRSGYVPSAPIAKALNDFYNLGTVRRRASKQQKAQYEVRIEDAAQELARLIWDGNIEQARRALYRIRHEQEWMEFDLADRLVCETVGDWNATPELAKAYDSVNLHPVDFRSPSSEAVHERLSGLASRCEERRRITRLSQRLGVSTSCLQRLRGVA